VTVADLCGVLVVDKPEGLTSFGVVKEVRRRLGVRKAGHTGTLDPMATGVLPVCLGEATKVAGLLTAGDKEYLGTCQLGVETDTLDLTGQVVAERSAEGVAREQVEQALAAMVGPQLQVPPAFSAVHAGGERAHVRARRGERVELEPRPVEVFRLELTGWSPPRLEIRVACSKGTYVRSLVADLGRALGCGAALAALRRLRSGPFDLARAVTLEQLEDGGCLGRCLDRLVSVDQALAHLPALEVDEAQARGLRHGQPFAFVPPQPAGLTGGPIRLRSGSDLVALGELRSGKVWPTRVFVGRVDIGTHIEEDGL
jgi:tRNA pseudouridine55 synthase